MRRTVLTLSVVALGLAACGGDDDSVLERIGAEPAADEPAPDADADAPDPGTAPDDADERDERDEPDDADEPTTGGPGAPVPGDAGDLQEILDELGIDLGDLEGLDPDMLDGLGLDELEDILGGLDEFISGFGGDGGGVVTVAGVRYEMTSDSCFSFADEFFIDGPAEGSDGSVAWIDANRSISTRAEMSEFLDEGSLDMLFGDSDVLDEMYLDVRVGVTSRFGFTDDEPNWSAMSDSGWAFGDGVVEFEFTGNGLRGAGEATDSNAVAADFGETVPIEFEFACN